MGKYEMFVNFIVNQIHAIDSIVNYNVIIIS